MQPQDSMRIILVNRFNFDSPRGFGLSHCEETIKPPESVNSK